MSCEVYRTKDSVMILCRDTSGVPDKWENSDKWICDYLNCVSGMGLAGMGSCPGNPFIEECPEFMSEEQAFDLWYPGWRKKEIGNAK